MYKLDIDSLDTHGSRSLFSIDYYLWLLFMIIIYDHIAARRQSNIYEYLHVVCKHWI